MTTRHSARRLSGPLFLAALFAFIAIQALPDLLWIDFEPFQRQPVVRQISYFLPMAYVSDWTLIVIETLALMLAASMIAGPGRPLSSPARRIALAVLVLATSIWFALVYSSWVLYVHSRVFLGIRDLPLALYLFDFAALQRIVGSRDAVSALVLLALSVMSSGAVVSLGRRLERKRLVPFGACVCAVIPVSALVQGSTLEPRLRENAATVLAHVVSPRLALLVSPFADAMEGRGPVVRGARIEPETRSFWEHPATAPGTKPNLLVLVVEALRYDTFAQGSATPFIRQLASEGRSFEKTFAQAADTATSKEAILTGLYPMKYPYRDLHFDGGVPHTLIYELLAEAGYRTSLLANEWVESKRLTDSPALSLHLDPKQLIGQVSGMEVQGSPLEQSDAIALTRLEQWIRKEPATTPWFSYFYIASPHFPYDCGAQDGDESAAQSASYFGYPESLAPLMRRRYERCLRAADDTVRDLFQFLKQEGRLANTIVVVTGDHGEYFGEHGLVAHSKRLFSAGLRVPLVLWGLPAGISAADSESTVAAHIDIAPTLLALAGLPPHPLHQGSSLVRIAGPVERRPLDPVFASTQLWNQEDTVISWPWRYTASESGDAPTLYNLEADPLEERNLAGSGSEMERKLSAYTAIYRRSQLAHYEHGGAASRGAAPPRYGSTELSEATSASSPLPE